MSIAAALLAGGAIGVRHAFEADHVAAVATLVEDESNTLRSGFVGTSWGVGHSLPVVALGLAFFLLGIRLPESVTMAFEAVVGIVLIALGVRLLLAAAGVSLRQHVHAHTHADSHTHAHDPGETHTHSHLGIGPLSLGSAHSHVDGRSFAVGALHGVAGSGGLVVLLVAAAPTLASAVAFLGAFSLLSILTMGAVSLAWSRALGTTWTTWFEVGSGLVGVAVGALLVVEQLGPVLP